MKFYQIEYEVDTGFRYLRDTALVKAKDENSANEKIRSHISMIGNDYTVTEIFYTREFTGDVFSERFCT